MTSMLTKLLKDYETKYGLSRVIFKYAGQCHLADRIREDESNAELEKLFLKEFTYKGVKPYRSEKFEGHYGLEFHAEIKENLKGSFNSRARDFRFISEGRLRKSLWEDTPSY